MKPVDSHNGSDIARVADGVEPPTTSVRVAGHGELAWPVAADERDQTLLLPTTQVARSCSSISSSSGSQGSATFQASRAFRRRLSVGFVEVPPRTGWLRAVHQHVEAATRVAVEIPEQQSGLSLRPPVECLSVHGESACRQNRDRRLRANEPVCNPRGGLAHALAS